MTPDSLKIRGIVSYFKYQQSSLAICYD